MLLAENVYFLFKNQLRPHLCFYISKKWEELWTKRAHLASHLSKNWGHGEKRVLLLSQNLENCHSKTSLFSIFSGLKFLLITGKVWHEMDQKCYIFFLQKVELSLYGDPEPRNAKLFIICNMTMIFPFYPQVPKFVKNIKK